MSIELMDCTLRDGANVVGKGFDEEITNIVLNGLVSCNIKYIEFGNAGGIGAYEVAGFTNALTDQEYLNIAQKYIGKGSEIGMFLNANRYMEKSIDLAADNGLSFIRVGADAGDSDVSIKSIKKIKSKNLKAFYSVMKAYLLDSDELVEEAKKLEEAGLDQITIMDSAGTMLPDEVEEYIKKLTNSLSIPVAFHGHNNMGMSAANAVASYKNGAKMLDCGLMGMARSAGNLPTEVCVAIMQRMGEMENIDFIKLLNFIQNELQPAMEKRGYHNSINPLDLCLGYSGMHSSFTKIFNKISLEENVDLFKLINEVSKRNRKNPSEELIKDVAKLLR